MAEDSWGGEERRLYERHSIVFPVEVQVVSPGAPPLRLVGISLKISRGGALLRLDKDARTGARCRVTFKQSAGRMEPTTVTGKIRRSGTGETCTRMVVVQFDHPLERVKSPGEL